MITAEQQAALRQPFPKTSIGYLPKGGQQLAYVGHAAVRDRLLSVDPTWTWSPFALTDTGLPLYDNAGGLWINLTVCGVTRPGYGDGPDPKQRISDAIRNAAMSFGVALDLWAKEDLAGSTGPTEKVTTTPHQGSPTPQAAAKQFPFPNEPGLPITSDQLRLVAIELKRIGNTDKAAMLTQVSTIVGREISTSRELTKGEASTLITALKAINMVSA
jgi:hypothetical protein